MPSIKTKDVEFLNLDCYKCSTCGHEAVILPMPWEQQSQCIKCGGQMMSWEWNGWKTNSIRQQYSEAKRRVAEIEGKLAVDQSTMNIEQFTDEERTIGKGIMVVNKLPAEAPWLSGLGACMVKIYGIRRRAHLVEFGIGNEQLPILGWVGAEAFYHEWPD